MKILTMLFSRSFNVSRQYWTLSLIVITGLLFNACDAGDESAKKPKSRDQLVQSIHIQTENSFIERKFNATVEAPNTVRLSSQLSGTIVKMPYRPGTAIKKGDLLVQLDDQLFQAEYDKAVASMEKAQSDYQRMQKLIPKKLASEEELTAAQTSLKLANAELKLKTVQLQHSKISAPFDGVISERLFEPGDSVSTNTHLLTVIDNRHFIIRSAVPESFLSFIRKQQAISVSLPSFDRILKAHITTIYPAVDPLTQQITIEAQFDENTDDLYPGQFAEITIRKLIDNVMLVPVNAVQYEANQTWVYTIGENNKATKTVVTTGQNISGRIMIRQGLKPGDQVITKGFVGLRPGKKVKIAESDNNLTQ